MFELLGFAGNLNVSARLEEGQRGGVEAWWARLEKGKISYWLPYITDETTFDSISKLTPPARSSLCLTPSSLISGPLTPSPPPHILILSLVK